MKNKKMEIKSTKSYWYNTIRNKVMTIIKPLLLVLILIAILYIGFYVLLFFILFAGISYLFKKNR